MKAVNLIPSEQRVAVKPAAGRAASAPPGGGAFGAYILLAALAFALVASALYVTTSNSIKDRKAQLADAEQQAQTVEAQASSLQAFADFKQLADSRVRTVKGLASGRFPWAAALSDVSRALPGDVYISSLDGTTSAESGGGSTLGSAISAPSIDLNGCAKNQTSVARLMSRLRNVRGVTRVSLAKSEATDTAATAAPAPATSPDGKTPSVSTEPCPKGSPPAFDMVVFFERAAVNPAALPNAGAAGIGPTGAAGPTGPTGSSGPTGGAGATTPASSTTTTSTTP